MLILPSRERNGRRGSGQRRVQEGPHIQKPPAPEVSRGIERIRRPVLHSTYLPFCLHVDRTGSGKTLNIFVSSVRSSNSHPDLLVTHPTTHPLFQITPVLNTGLSLSEPLQLYKGYNAI